VGTAFGACLLLGLVTLGQGGVVLDGGRVTLRSATTEVAVSTGTSPSIVSLRDMPTGREFAAGAEDDELFWLAFSPAGNPAAGLTWLNSRQARSTACEVRDEDGVETAVLTFRNIDGRDIDAECRASLTGDGQIAWRIRVESGEPIVLEEVGFPVVALRAPLEGDGSADRLAAGLTKGGVFHQPSKWETGATLYARQPGELAAQFGCYYAPDAGLCTATRDADGYPKALQFRRTADGLQLAWRHMPFEQMPGAFASAYDVVLTTFGPGDEGVPVDWRDGADIYRRWALAQPWCAATSAERADLPHWLKQGPAMVRFTREWLAHPERIEAWLNDYWRPRFPGVPLIVAFWGWEKVDSWISPDYFPPFPSEQDLARCVEAVHAAGGRTFFWPSGYHWAETYGRKDDGSFEWDDRERFRRVGLPHAVLKRDGTPWGWAPPWLRGGTNRSLCRGDEWTRDWFDNIGVELARRGADMIQVDQVVGGLPPAGGECFSTQHGHPPGGGPWDAEAFHEQLRSLRRRCAQVNPDIVLGIEEPQELFIQHVGVQDYRDTQDRYGRPAQDERASVFGYLYHDFVPCFQSNPRAGDLRGMAYCLATGQMPHVVPHWPIGPASLLRNGAFEQWSGDAPDGWEHVQGYQGKSYEGRVSYEADGGPGGKPCITIETEGEDDIGQVSQNVPIGPDHLVPGRRYRFSLQYEVARQAQPNRVILGAFDEDWQSKGSWALPMEESGGWRRGAVEFTIPDGAVRLRVMLHVQAPARIRFADVALEEPGGEGGWRTAMSTGEPAGGTLAGQWVRLFHGEGRPYLLLGCMLHPPRLEASDDVLCNAFEAPDGSQAAVLVNASARPQDCRLHWQGEARDLHLAPWEVKLIQ
jgi:hypothetical protein